MKAAEAPRVARLTDAKLTSGAARGPRDGACCAELRCGCGSLLARRVDGGVELKCRRCKRTLVLPLSDG